VQARVELYVRLRPELPTYLLACHDSALTVGEQVQELGRLRRQVLRLTSVQTTQLAAPGVKLELAELESIRQPRSLPQREYAPCSRAETGFAPVSARSQCFLRVLAASFVDACVACIDAGASLILQGGHRPWS